MPSTYTLNNGIELIATGEQSGTWGDTTNTNFELLDTSLDGQVTVTLASTGSSGSPNALPVSDGAASNGRNRLVIFNDSSDLGGTAFVQLTPNDAEKIIYVRNSLSGSRSILLFQGTYSASNDYEVPAGTTAVVFFNGAGSGAVAANVFNNAHFDNLNIVGNISLTSDGSVINIGADNDLKITHDGTDGDFESAGTLTFDVASNIILDPDAGNVLLKDNGVEFGRFNSDGGDFTLYTDTANKHIIFKGNDGGSAVNALDLDMENAGRFTFLSGGVINESGADSDFRIESNSNTHMLFIDADVDKISLGTSSSDTQTIEGSAVGRVRIQDGASIGYTMTGSGNSRDMFNLDTPGSWAGSGNSGTYTSMRWSNGVGNTMGRIGLRYGAASTNTGAQSEITIMDLYATDFGNSGDITSFGATKLMVHQGGAIFNESGADADFRIESDTSTHAIFVDASTSRIGFFNSSPSAPLHLIAGTSGGSLSDAFQISDSGYVNIAMYSGGADGEIRVGAAGVLRGAYKAQYAGTRSSNDFHVGVQDTTGMFTIDGGGGSLTINERGADTDFRVESDATSHMLFVNAGTDTVQIRSSTSPSFGTFPVPSLYVKGTSDGKYGIAHFEGQADQSVLGLGHDAAGDRFVFQTSYRSTGAFSTLQFHDPSNNSVLTLGLNSTSAENVFNDAGIDHDFRVESDSSADMLFVDAGSNVVGINTSSTTSGRGELGVGGMLYFEPGGTSFQTDNPRPSLKRDADGELRISAGSDSGSKLTFYTAPSSGGTLAQRMQIDRNGELFAPKVIRSYNNSSVYFGKHTDAVSLPNSTDTIVATLTKTGYAYYLAGEFRLVIYDSSSPWGVYNYNQTISGKTSTHTGGGMGVGLGTAEIVSRLDYTPTVTLVDNRATGGESTATWQIKVNPGTNGPASALTIFQGYMAGATWT